MEAITVPVLVPDSPKQAFRTAESADRLDRIPQSDRGHRARMRAHPRSAGDPGRRRGVRHLPPRSNRAPARGGKCGVSGVAERRRHAIGLQRTRLLRHGRRSGTGGHGGWGTWRNHRRLEIPAPDSLRHRRRAGGLPSGRLPASPRSEFLGSSRTGRRHPTQPPSRPSSSVSRFRPGSAIGSRRNRRRRCLRHNPLASGALAFAIADVSGHGLPAALEARDVLVGLRMGAARHMKIDATVEKLNQDSLPFHPLFPIRLAGLRRASESDGRFQFVNAGHPQPVLVNPGSTHGFPETGLVLGSPRTSDIASGTGTIEPGGVLVLVTDGILETAFAVGRGVRRFPRRVPGAGAEAKARRMDRERALRGADRALLRNESGRRRHRPSDQTRRVASGDFTSFRQDASGRDNAVMWSWIPSGGLEPAPKLHGCAVSLLLRDERNDPSRAASPSTRPSGSRRRCSSRLIAARDLDSTAYAVWTGLSVAGLSSSTSSSPRTARNPGPLDRPHRRERRPRDLASGASSLASR